MDLSELHQRYTVASSKASDIGRQLAFAGIAIVWLFSGGDVSPSGGIDVADGLWWPGLLLVLTLGFDFSHAVYAAASWGFYAWLLEGRGMTEDIDAPRALLWPTLGLFWCKLGCLGAAYVFLICYFSSRV